MKKKRRRRMTWAAISAFILIAFGMTAILIRAPATRSDPKIPKAEAVRIRDAALAANDVPAYIAIQEGFFFSAKHGKHLETQLKSYWRQGQYRALFLEFANASKRVDQCRMDFWVDVINETDKLPYRPRLKLEIRRKLAEANKRVNGAPGEHAALYPPGSNGSLWQYLLHQGLIGESLDEKWYDAMEFGDAREYCILIGYGLREFENSFGDRNNPRGSYESDPGSPFAGRLLAIWLWRVGRLAEAEPLLAAAAEKIEDDPLGRYAWAESRRELGLEFDPERIMGQPCRQSIHFATQEGTRLTYLAELHAALGNPAKAIIAAEAAVTIDPREDQAWAILAESYREAGETGKADLAETNAKRWSEAEQRIRDTWRAYYLPKPKERRDEDLTKLIDAVAEAEWDSLSRCWSLLRQIPNKADRTRVLRTRPDFATAGPDRFFQPRPVSIKDRTSVKQSRKDQR